MRLLTFALAASAAAQLLARDPAQLRREIEERHHPGHHKKKDAPMFTAPINGTSDPTLVPHGTGAPPSKTCVRSTTTVTITTFDIPIATPPWSNTTGAISGPVGASTVNPSFVSIPDYESAPQSSSSLAVDDYTSSPTTSAMATASMSVSGVTGSTTGLSPLPPLSSSNPAIESCPSQPFNATAMGPFFGLNVVNTKPFAHSEMQVFKQPEDWDTAFSILKLNFPTINAVRIYSTMDPTAVPPTHLKNSLPAAAKYNLQILAGVWSGGIDAQDRFKQELSALEGAIQLHGCKNIAAVSVGNEDINDVEKYFGPNADQRKSDTVDLLVQQIANTRDLLRRNKCCNVPVTHTDTWNQLFNVTGAPYLSRLWASVDQAMIANIFPFWGNVTVQDSYKIMGNQSSTTQAIAKSFGKELWLGETGWPTIDHGNNNEHGTNVQDAQTYFNKLGCQILAGKGTAFYYVDWDEDQVDLNKPAFGLLKHDGTSMFDLSCQNFKVDIYAKTEYPKWLGGDGV